MKLFKLSSICLIFAALLAAQDRLIVGLNEEDTAEESELLIRSHGAKMERMLDRLNAAVVILPKGQEKKIREDMERSKKFRYVETDYKLNAVAVPNDPQYVYQWHLPVIAAESAWDVTTGANTVKIVVADTGIDSTQEDLVGKVNTGWDFVSGATATNDWVGHGTMVAGTAAANTNNAIGVAAIGWNSQVVPYVISHDGSSYYSIVASAFQKAADDGYKIVNISFGGGPPSLTIDSAVDYAWNRGTLIFASAGNSGSNSIDVGYPAGSPKIVAVGSVGQGDIRSGFSNYGTWVDFFAPGESILTTMNGGGYAYVSGTSFSAPLAAGVAALMLGKNPTLTPQQITDILIQTADLLPNGDKRINAANAVNMAGTPPPSPDTTAPTVKFQLRNNVTVSGNVPINITASDNVGVVKVVLWITASRASLFASAEDTQEPWYFYWNTTPYRGQTVTLKAFAYDAVGNMGQTSIKVRVK